MKKVLIVIDMQNDFIYGELSTPEAREIIPVIKDKIEKAKANGEEIVFTRDSHNMDYEARADFYFSSMEGKCFPVHCVTGEEGYEVISEIDDPMCLHIDKDSFGGIEWSTELFDFDEIGDVIEYDEFEVCGVVTDICVISNVLALRSAYPKARIVIDALACAGTCPEKHIMALNVMESCLVDVINKE